MDKYIFEAVVALLKNGNGKNGLNGNGLNGNGLKNGIEPPNPAVLAEAKAISETVLKNRETHRNYLNTGTGEKPLNFDSNRLTNDLATEIEQARIDTYLRKNHLPLTNELGKRGMTRQAQTHIHGMRLDANNEFLQPSVAEESLLNLNPYALTHLDVIHKYNSGGRSMKVPKGVGEEWQRPVKIAKAKSRQSSKNKTRERRKAHTPTQEYENLDTKRKDLNKKEIERQKRLGIYNPKDQFHGKFVSIEHDIRLAAKNFWDHLGRNGGNEGWNIFIQTNQLARFFKDDLETDFYRWIKTKGNNWYLKTDRTNGVDVEVWEINPPRKLGVVPFPESFLNRGQNISKEISRFKQILRSFAEGYKE